MGVAFSFNKKRARFRPSLERRFRRAYDDRRAPRDDEYPLRPPPTATLRARLRLRCFQLFASLCRLARMLSPGVVCAVLRLPIVWMTFNRWRAPRPGILAGRTVAAILTRSKMFRLALSRLALSGQAFSRIAYLRGRVYFALFTATSGTTAIARCSEKPFWPAAAIT